MKKIIISSLLSPFPFWVQSQIRLRLNHSKNEGSTGNQLYYLPNQEVPFTGKAVDYWPDGHMKTEISYKEGKRHGPKTHWYENGQKLSEINYMNGKHDGLLDCLVREWTTEENREQC